MFHFSRRTKIFLALLVVVLSGYIASSKLGFTSTGVPADFKEARYQGSILAQDIVNISNRITAELAAINELDKQGNLTEALNRVTELGRQRDEMRAKAIELSNRLSQMTGAVSSIKSEEARRAAFESISGRLALISRLFSYGDYLDQLSAALRARFTGAPARVKVEAVIAQINAEVNAINNFNAQAGQAMDRFDEIISK